MIKNLLILLFITLSTFCQIQTDKTYTNPESRQFDFWLGKWEVEWKDKEGITRTGSNNVIALFDSCVIEENFNGQPGTELVGKSFSVYDKKEKKWKQTWVDNSGAYLDFTGNYNDGKMILSRRTIDNTGSALYQRMIYYNISGNSFDWNWEISHDNGKNWELRWKLHYVRK